MMILLTGVFTSVDAFAVSSSAMSKVTQVMCRNKSEVRTVRIKIKGLACEAYYTKSGQDQLVAKSGTAEKCYSILDKIKGNLESAAWSCKDISESRVSTSMEP